jgi:hypothetical protein
MQKVLIALSFGFVVLFQAPQAHALSCLPVDMYLDSVVGDDTTQVFIGTATEVKNHAQVVTVSKALQGWVAPQVWVEHPYSTDWQYFCSNGPAVKGKETIFLTMIDENNVRTVTQTVAVDSELGKDLIKMLEKESVDAGITEATSVERAEELKQSIVELLKVLVGMLRELAYWQNTSAR